MEPIEFIKPWYYSTAFYFLFLVLSWGTILYYLGSNSQKILHSEGSPSQGAAFFLTLLMSFYLGLRQIARDFGDTASYASNFRHLDEYSPVNFRTEWLWQNIQYFFKSVLGMNVHDFFVFVALVFFFGMFICSLILTRKNLWLAMLFFFTALQTFTYGTNGIRNGMALSMVLVSIALLAEYGKSRQFLAAIIMILALFIHRSSMLPSLSAFISLYFIKDTKLGLRFWLVSIAVSLLAGPLVTQFFAALGFDDRMTTYSQMEASEEIFSHTGFRWDFLLYSVFPVFMIWYVTRQRRFNDPAYSVVANTYLLCNAFWIMVIRSSFSNRFAYLSWFLYPVVIFYPLLRMNIWRDQDRKTAIIFFLYTSFTNFMFFIYYFGTTGFRGFDQYWWRE
jgi:hypothetical protein